VERIDGQGRLAGSPESTVDGDTLQLAPWSVPADAYGDFLCTIFDEWIRHDVGEVFVQFFDMQVGLWLGHQATLCVFAEICGRGLAIEHNGDVFACDHYVYPEFRLGNIMERPLAALAAAPEQQEFGEN